MENMAETREMNALSDRVSRGPRQPGSLLQKESPAVAAGTGGGPATDVVTAFLI